MKLAVLATHELNGKLLEAGQIIEIPDSEAEVLISQHWRFGFRYPILEPLRKTAILCDSSLPVEQEQQKFGKGIASLNIDYEEPREVEPEIRQGHTAPIPTSTITPLVPDDYIEPFVKMDSPKPRGRAKKR